MAAYADDEIARRIRRGDPRAFDAFFARFGRPLLHYLAGLAGDRALAEDLVQETVLRVHRGISRYEERGTFQAWVFRIATNLALTELRRRPCPPAAPLDALALAQPDPEPADADAPIEAARRARLLAEALARLPAGQRAVLLLRVREGMGVAAIARALAIPVGTVKSRIHHAVRRLRAQVELEHGRTWEGEDR